jgi:hypothetical protein
MMLKISRKKSVLYTPPHILRDSSGVKDLSEIDKDPTRTPQGLLKDFI